MATPSCRSCWPASDSRRSFSAQWYDALGRPTTSASYGTHGDAALTDYDPATSGNQAYTDTPPAPNSHDQIIAGKSEYDAEGHVYKLTDNKGIVTQLAFDDLGRQTKLIENYVNGAATETETDTDRLTETKYDSAGRRSELWAYNPKGSGNGVEIQKTRYLYGNTVNSIAPISNALMSNGIYPDSSDTDGTGTDQVKTGYDYLGRRKSLTDQRGVTRTFSYDSAGRMQADDAGTGSLPSGVDGTVRKVGLTYDDIGRVAKVSSYDSSSAVVNEVKFTYGSYGQVTQSEQAHNGTVTSGTPAVTYSYADGAASGEAKYLRLTSVGYPGGSRTIYHNYPASGTGDMLSRLDNVADDASGTSKYAQYTYLGGGAITRVEHPAVTNGLTLSYGTGGTYSGLDRFGRVIDQKWTNGAGTTTFDRYQYGYDRAGNRISKANSQTSGKDEYYEYDGLHRLNKMNRGTLSSGSIADGSATFNQHWQTLETIGNWKSFRWDADGGADGWTTQSRTHNAANEMNTVSGAGADWIDPVHDAAGSMTQMPKPGDETTRLHATYDAWNRLAEVKADASGSPGTTIATYRYDGLNRRISKSLNGSDTFDYYYNESWQLLETRKNADIDPLEQYVWDIRYVDAPMLRWRDTNTDGTVDETLYYTNDANMNVTALVDTNGTVQERYAYDPYGKASIFDGNWTARTSSSHDNPILFAGYRHDAETGLYHVRYRYYHLTVGKWVGREPLGYVDGMNLYAYVKGGPMNFVDPYGTEAQKLKNPFEGVSRDNIYGPGGSKGYEPSDYAKSPLDGRDNYLPPTTMDMALRQKEKARLGAVVKGLCPKGAFVRKDGNCCSPEDCTAQAQEIADAIVDAVGGQPWQPGGNIGNAFGNACGDWQSIAGGAANSIIDKYRGKKKACFESAYVHGTNWTNFFEHHWIEIALGGSTVAIDPWPTGGKGNLDDTSATKRFPSQKKWPQKTCGIQMIIPLNKP